MMMVLVVMFLVVMVLQWQTGQCAILPHPRKKSVIVIVMVTLICRF